MPDPIVRPVRVRFAPSPTGPLALCSSMIASMKLPGSLPSIGAALSSVRMSDSMRIVSRSNCGPARCLVYQIARARDMVKFGVARFSPFECALPLV